MSSESAPEAKLGKLRVKKLIHKVNRWSSKTHFTRLFFETFENYKLVLWNYRSISSGHVSWFVKLARFLALYWLLLRERRVKKNQRVEILSQFTVILNRWPQKCANGPMSARRKRVSTKKGWENYVKLENSGFFNKSLANPCTVIGLVTEGCFDIGQLEKILNLTCGYHSDEWGSKSCDSVPFHLGVYATLWSEWD